LTTIRAEKNDMRSNSVPNSGMHARRTTDGTVTVSIVMVAGSAAMP